MAAPIIQANYDELERMATQFDRQSTAIERVGRHITGVADSLVGKAWTGEGAIAFERELYDEVLPAVTRLQHAMTESAVTTRRIAALMRHAEEEAARLFERGGTKGAGNSVGQNGKAKIDEGRRINGYEGVSDTALFATGGSDGQDIHPNDVSQGRFGDCFFLTSLIAIADQNPQIIRDAITDNGDGTYSVTFYENGQPETVTVEAKFPVYEVYDKETGTWGRDSAIPLASAGAGDGELWVRLMENAYATWLGDGDITSGYSILDQGGQSRYVFEDLTGVPSQSTSNMGAYSLQDLADLHNSGHVITLSSLNSSRTGMFSGLANRIFGNENGFYDAGSNSQQLYTNHAYWIDSVDAENNVIVVRNPWGYEDSPTKRLELTYEEFIASFDRIDMNSLDLGQGEE